MFPESSWYALTVKPRREKAVVQSLRARHFEEFLPLYSDTRKWSDRWKSIALPLFPGYVFCRFSYADRLPILNTLGVISVVSFGNTMTSISDADIASMRTIVASGIPVRSLPYLLVGQRVRVEGGPLTGLEGTLMREKSSYRVVLNVDVLSRSIVVEVERSLVRVIREARSSVSGRLSAKSTPSRSSLCMS